MKLKICTYNIQTGLWFWPCRRKQVIANIKAIDADIFCFQEVLPSQRRDLRKSLPQYFSYSEGRGGILNEACSVFYEPHKAGAAFLDTIKISRGLFFPRIATVVYFQKDGVDFQVINTHLPVFSKKARAKCLERIEAMLEGPFILCGDFNMKEEEFVEQKISGFVTHRVHKIDYICSSGSIKSWKVVKAKGSDHYPLVAEIEL